MRWQSWLIAGQAMLLSGAALLLTLVPPATGPVLAVPLAGAGAARLIDAHLRVIGSGRLPGSLVLTGDRPSFWAALTENRVLILPALPALCGESQNTESRS